MIIGGVSAYFVIDSQNIDTHFIIDGTSISTDDYLDFRLVDSNNESVAGQRVYAELVSADGESKNYTLSSDEKGIVTLSDKLDEGNYTISARFEGGDGYKSCEFKDVQISVYKKQVQTTSSTSSSTSSDPYYEAGWDDDHQDATPDNPVTVTKPDGDTYTYYGPGHYDYYAGGSHMSGEYYKQKKWIAGIYNM